MSLRAETERRKANLRQTIRIKTINAALELLALCREPTSPSDTSLIFLPAPTNAKTITLEGSCQRLQQLKQTQSPTNSPDTLEAMKVREAWLSTYANTFRNMSSLLGPVSKCDRLQQRWNAADAPLRATESYIFTLAKPTMLRFRPQLQKPITLTGDNYDTLMNLHALCEQLVGLPWNKCPNAS